MTSVAIWLGLQDDEPLEPATLDEIVQSTSAAVDSRLTVSVAGNTRILNVSFWSEDPVLAAKVVNTLVQLYIDSQGKDKVEAVKDLDQMLVGPLHELQENARVADTALSEYRKTAGFLDINETPLVARQIMEASQRLDEVRAERQASESRLRDIETSRNLESNSQVLGNRSIQDLRMQVARASQQIADLTTSLGDKHPQVMTLRSQMRDAERTIAVEIKKITDSIARDVSVLRMREASLQADLDNLRNQYEQQNEAHVRLRELEREATVNHNLLSTFLERHKQLQVQSIFEHSNASILTVADIPTSPSSPKILILLAIAGVTSFSFSGCIAYLRDNKVSGFRSLDEISAVLPGAAVGIIPTTGHRKRQAEDIVITDPRSAYAEAFRRLLTAVAITSAKPPRCLLVTSSVPQEGKTTVALSLARVAAQAGMRTIVVDCDFRRPALQRSLGATPKAGLVEVITGQSKLEDVIVRDRASDLEMICTGHFRGDFLALLTSKAFDNLMFQLRLDYDLVIIDSPPSAVVSDTHVLTRMADATLFVVKWGQTRQNLAVSEFNTLLSNGCPGGILLNQVDARKMSLHKFSDSGLYSRAYSSTYYKS